MGTMTTSATIINLFWTGYLIKKRGVQAAMSQQTLWAAFRNVTQLYARVSSLRTPPPLPRADADPADLPRPPSVTLGGQAGVSIMQFTQLFNILGGAGGYLLCSNAYIGEIVSGEERTAAFGALQGYVMRACAHSTVRRRLSLLTRPSHLPSSSVARAVGFTCESHVV